MLNRFNLRIFLVYLLIFIVLSVVLYKQNQIRIQGAHDLQSAVERLKEMHFINQFWLSEPQRSIEKNAREFPSFLAQHMQLQCRWMLREKGRLDTLTRTLQNDVSTDSMSIKRVGELVQSSRAYLDSLHLFVEMSPKLVLRPPVLPEIGTTLNQSFANSNAAKEHKQISTLVLQQKLDRATTETLAFFEKIIDLDASSFDACYPIVSFSKDCPKAGEAFQMFVQAAPYDSNSDQTHYWLNNKEIKADKGIAHYATKFPTSGLKVSHIKISRTNPLTGVIQSTQREDQIQICQ